MSSAALYCPNCGAAEPSNRPPNPWAVFGAVVLGLGLGVFFTLTIFFALTSLGNGTTDRVIPFVFFFVTAMAVVALVVQARMRMPVFLHAFFIALLATMLGMLSICDIMMLSSFFTPH